MIILETFTESARGWIGVTIEIILLVAAAVGGIWHAVQRLVNSTAASIREDLGTTTENCTRHSERLDLYGTRLTVLEGDTKGLIGSFERVAEKLEGIDRTLEAIRKDSAEEAKLNEGRHQRLAANQEILMKKQGL